MTTPLEFNKPALISLNGNPLSDHNRRPLSVRIERIGNPRRMANGTLRKYVIADKRTFSVSWDDLPHNSDYTVDGFWGASEIEDAYNTFAGVLLLTVATDNGAATDYNVMISNFSKELTKRGAYDFYDVQLEMEEV